MGMTILCENSRCIHFGGEGYYSVCKHPNCKNLGNYGGIDRIYQESCKLAEYKKEKENE